VANSSSINTFERIMASLPGWMMIFAGVAMVAMVTLTPAWIATRELEWQLKVVQKQSQQLVQQQVAYEKFATALREKDPVAIERLAYYHLRLKPAGLATMDQINQPQQMQAVAHRIWQTMPTIEDLLAQPIYKPSQYCPPGVIPDTRMVRVATGPHRFLLLGFGVVCLFFGVLPPSRETMLALASAGTAAAVMDEEDALAAVEEWADEQDAEEVDEVEEELAADGRAEDVDPVAAAATAVATATAAAAMIKDDEASEVTEAPASDASHEAVLEASDEYAAVVAAEELVEAEVEDAQVESPSEPVADVTSDTVTSDTAAFESEADPAEEEQLEEDVLVAMLDEEEEEVAEVLDQIEESDSEKSDSEDTESEDSSSQT